MAMKVDKRLKILFILLAFLIMPGYSFCQASYPSDTIMSRINHDLHSQIETVFKLDSTVTSNKGSLQSNSTWPDINYSNPASEYLDRIKNFALAYTCESSSFHADNNLYNTIVNALQYWINANPSNSNWWYNEISFPAQLGEILILMRYANTALPVALENTVLTRMNRGIDYPSAQTGANRTDVALHYLYLGVLTKNDSIMNIAVKRSFDSIVFTTEEGLQHDYSYFQHSNQLQISSYGSVYLTNAINVGVYVRGTPYALSSTQLSMISNYYRNTYLKTIRGKYIDFSVEGRGISRPDILSKEKETKRIQKAKIIDPANNSAWDAAIARTTGAQPPSYSIAPIHTQFWRGDYTIHLRPAYSFNVRTVSSRTMRTEKGNNENIFGKFLTDGTTCIQRRGGEYYNILPVWEWDKIPGVTARDFDTNASATITSEWGFNPGSTPFVGGVSDGIYGANAYDLNYNNVTAKKSWFYFDN